LQGRSLFKALLSTAAVITVVVAVSCLTLPRGIALTAISDIGGALLTIAALIAFAANGLASKGRLRWFWMLLASGWALWLADQFVWIFYDLILKHKLPAMFPADALLFLAGAPMVGALLLRPHREPPEHGARLGLLDFLRLLVWWVYLYVSFVMSWQYPSPNEAIYSRNFDLLADAQSVMLVASCWLSGTRVRERGEGFTHSLPGPQFSIPSLSSSSTGLWSKAGTTPAAGTTSRTTRRSLSTPLLQWLDTDWFQPGTTQATKSTVDGSRILRC